VLATAGYYVRAEDAPIATMGTEVIRESGFEHYLATSYPPEQAALLRKPSTARQRALTEFLDSVALLAKARRLGIDQELRFKKAVQLGETKLLARLVSERSRNQILEQLKVTETEERAYYQEHKSAYLVEPQFTARHLLVYVKGNPAFPDQGLPDNQARAKAKAALEDLRAGSTWEEVAKAYSDDVGSRQAGGLISERQFGYFASEFEQAVKIQPLGVPGDVIKTAFGYYVLQVEARVTEKTPLPFETVRERIHQQLTETRASDARNAFMTPIWREVGFSIAEAGTRDTPLLDESNVNESELLATIAGKPVVESEFRWFLKDALIPSQRANSYAQPGARLSMLGSFFDQLVLAAKARKDGLDQTRQFALQRETMQKSLLLEFALNYDKAGPFCTTCGNTDEEREHSKKAYFERVRREVGLVIAKTQLEQPSRHCRERGAPPFDLSSDQSVRKMPGRRSGSTALIR